MKNWHLKNILNITIFVNDLLVKHFTLYLVIWNVIFVMSSCQMIKPKMLMMVCVRVQSVVVWKNKSLSISVSFFPVKTFLNIKKRRFLVPHLVNSRKMYEMTAINLFSVWHKCYFAALIVFLVKNLFFPLTNNNTEFLVHLGAFSCRVYHLNRIRSR